MQENREMAKEVLVARVLLVNQTGFVNILAAL